MICARHILVYIFQSDDIIHYISLSINITNFYSIVYIKRGHAVRKELNLYYNV